MKKIISLLFLSIFIFSSANAQDVNLTSFMEKVESASLKYVELFKNLTADESKTITTFKKDGTTDSTRLIKSNFIVYQTEKEDKTSEFRMVYQQNGKAVLKSDADVVKFFEKLTKSDNAQEEFKRVKNESLRFDGNIRVWGVTLNQDFFFKSEVRKIFDYKFIEKTKINGREIYVIEFRQKEYSPFILSNPTKEESQNSKGFEFNSPLSDSLKPTNPRMNGTMWLDAETAQVWRINYEVSINPANIGKSLLITKSSYQYQPSKFGILTPSVITISSHRVFGKKSNDVESKLFGTVVLKYSNFENIGSEIKDYKVGK